MEGANSANSLNQKRNEVIKQETVCKLMLQSLIKRFSLERITKEITSMLYKNKKDIVLDNHKSPLDSNDIIAVMYVTVGPIKMLECLLDNETRCNKASDKIKTETVDESKENSTTIEEAKEEEIIYRDHYELYEGILYKYIIKEINDNNVQYMCDNSFCSAAGIFWKKNKEFEALGSHSNECTNMNKNPKNLKVLNYMEERKITGLQLTRKK